MVKKITLLFSYRTTLQLLPKKHFVSKTKFMLIAIIKETIIREPPTSSKCNSHYIPFETPLLQC